MSHNFQLLYSLEISDKCELFQGSLTRALASLELFH